ncbi:hypothetical protein LDENG_00064190 [Lucifuga dentata]|nr:hypothetical protein LDENG_00064190 [Lucifuga dentata]
MPTLTVDVHKVLKLLRRPKTQKVPGPDHILPSTFKHCADQLAPIFTDIFNQSLQMCTVPSCLKTLTVIPVPKKSRIVNFMTTGLSL